MPSARPISINTRIGPLAYGQTQGFFAVGDRVTDFETERLQLLLHVAGDDPLVFDHHDGRLGKCGSVLLS